MWRRISSLFEEHLSKRAKWARPWSSLWWQDYCTYLFSLCIRIMPFYIFKNIWLILKSCRITRILVSEGYLKIEIHCWRVKYIKRLQVKNSNSQLFYMELCTFVQISSWINFNNFYPVRLMVKKCFNCPMY